MNELIFSPGASPFTINAAGDQELTISGIGITNDSGIAQNFVFPTFAGVVLTNNATVGDMIFFTLKGGHGKKIQAVSRLFLIPRAPGMARSF